MTSMCAGGCVRTKKNKWYMILYIKHSNGNTSKKEIATGLEEKNNKRNVQKMLKAKIEEYNDLHSQKSGDMLFTDLLIEWLRDIQLRVKENTFSCIL